MIAKYIMNGNTYGRLMLFIGLLLGAPVLVLPFYQSESYYAGAFLIPMAVSVVLGLFVCIKTSRVREGQEKSEWRSPLRQGSGPVMFAWAYGILMGAIPFVIGDQLNFIHALFESVSGWTTTGLTVVDIGVTPKIFLFHRSYMQYCGGLGFILMMAMFIQGKQSVSQYNAEGHLDRLMPSLKKTARATFMLYNGFLVIGSLLYCIFGMDLFDAVCHTMSALSTAGYSTQAASIGYYSSVPIEIITVVLMLIGASNFAILLLLAERKVKQLFRVTEMRVMLGLLAIFVPLTTISLMVRMDMGLGEGLRQALFGVVTVFSTTGYSLMDYSLWPPFAVGLIMLLMIIGGSSGSTAGGIKLSRTYFLIRVTRENIKKRQSPSLMVTTPSYTTSRGKAPIDDALIADTFGFVACYMGVFIVGTLLMTITEGCSLMDAMFEFASAFGTVGISNGLTGLHTSTPTLVIEMIGMILGRLEMFVVFMGIAAGIRAVNGKIRR